MIEVFVIDDGLVAGGSGEKFLPWSPQQKAYLKLRIQGLTMREAATSVDVHVNTASNWEMHRPELNMRAAIEAGKAFRVGMGTEEAISEIAGTIESVCHQVTVPITMALVSELLQKHNAVDELISVVMGIMKNGKRDCDQLTAAKLLAQIAGIDHPPRASTTTETTTVNGITPGVRESIDKDLLGVHSRQRAWDSMRSGAPASADETE